MGEKHQLLYSLLLFREIRKPVDLQPACHSCWSGLRLRLGWKYSFQINPYIGKKNHYTFTERCLNERPLPFHSSFTRGLHTLRRATSVRSPRELST
ncbi:hypothetical protein AOLI_G00068340 [Acnodon oligacanthus]